MPLGPYVNDVDSLLESIIKFNITCQKPEPYTIREE